MGEAGAFASVCVWRLHWRAAGGARAAPQRVVAGGAARSPGSGTRQLGGSRRDARAGKRWEGAGREAAWRAAERGHLFFARRQAGGGRRRVAPG